jgi:hypothetical protein
LPVRVRGGAQVFELSFPEFLVRHILLALLVTLGASGCAVVAVADAAVTVAATAVSVGASVVGTTVEVAAAGIEAVVGDDDKEEEEDEEGEGRD